nr:immunoglobulin light chain junction region [Macaca mulatta]MOW63331.1 immunoglobulin light chain junction region [Macaca mulatta]
CLQYTNSPYSF